MRLFVGDVLMTLASRLGSWKGALEAAGLGISKMAGISDESLFENTLCKN